MGRIGLPILRFHPHGVCHDNDGRMGRGVTPPSGSCRRSPVPRRQAADCRASLAVVGYACSGHGKGRNDEAVSRQDNRRTGEMRHASPLPLGTWLPCDDALFEGMLDEKSQIGPGETPGNRSCPSAVLDGDAQATCRGPAHRARLSPDGARNGAAGGLR